ncbi:hypothetical protein NPIL_64251 [Nephila pilipes]|uniref:Uncharacterized protein n=1 Tax=Nephila pilipes TaxID=299642 RepID=A0A8X6QBG4_NEPPI|nr:hypothetical protein NPIL_64251 [Nephila pilipes]
MSLVYNLSPLLKDDVEPAWLVLSNLLSGEEMVNLARTGFASHQNHGRKEFQNEQLKHSGESSTACALEIFKKQPILTAVKKLDRKESDVTYSAFHVAAVVIKDMEYYDLFGI